MTLLGRFIHDESGATAVEYGLLSALVALVVIAGIRGLGTKVNGTFTKISGNL